nr:vesicle-associated protein 2-2-like [Tanacetum cinerariifolium]
MLKRLYVRPSKVDAADHFGEIQPQELKFRFKPKTQISCIVTLTNKSNCHMAFKVKASDVKTYCARPGVGIIKPHSTCQVQLTRQAQDIVPPSSVIAKEKFLFQRAFVPRNTSINDVSDIFRANEGGKIDQTKLKVVLDVPKEVIEEKELEIALQELALKLKNLNVSGSMAKVGAKACVQKRSQSFLDKLKFCKDRFKHRQQAKLLSQVVRALEGDVSLSDLDEGIKLGHNSIYNGSSDYDTVQYNVDMDKLKKMALETPEYAT